MSYPIFISYRRKDSTANVNTIYNYLTDSKWFTKNDVFRDMGSIEWGEKWKDKIQKSLEEAKIILVVIGKNWLCKKQGKLRICDPEDWVRKEIEMAISLEKEKLVIPLLINGTPVPKKELLPEPIKNLFDANVKDIFLNGDNEDLDSLANFLYQKIKYFNDPDEVKKSLIPVLASKYEIETSIGVGNKAKVYLGKDTGLQRRVAIKVLMNKDFKDEFVNTLIDAAKINDLVPNSITVLGAYVKHDPCHVIMPYLEIGTLREYMKEERAQSFEFIKKTLHTIGKVLKKIHQEKMTHCNVKPSNIILDDEYDSFLNPLSRIRIQKVKKDIILSHISTIAEKVSPTVNSSDLQTIYMEELCYLPPEIFDSGPEIDPLKKAKKIDQFMLGLLAYELITGKIPPTLKSIDELRTEGKKAFQNLPALTDIRKDCPDRLAKIIHKMIEYDPDERYENLDEPVKAIEAITFDDHEIAKESFHRCMSDGTGNLFFKSFYKELIKMSPEAADKFKNKEGIGNNDTDRQYTMLREAIFMLLQFGKTDGDENEPNILSRIAQMHGHGKDNFNISNDAYDCFVNAFLSSVCGSSSNAPFDNRCTISEQEKNIIKKAWGNALTPGIKYMKSK